MTYGQKENVAAPTAPPDKHEEREVAALLELLHRERGFDFSGYKPSPLIRRIHRRMAAVEVASLSDYLGYVERSPDELDELVDALHINVTAFFREPAAWDALAARLPRIIDPHGDTPIRVWSAGCSSGEEPYTLAMVLCEALGEQVFARRVKVYATDIDEDALDLARQATYASKALDVVPAPLVDKYFTSSGDTFTFKRELLRNVVFGRHDLLQDAPIPHVDVIACRNSLMYFTPESQEQVLERLRFALNPGGLLMLGKAEMLLSHSKLFSPVDLKLRLFTPAIAERSIRWGPVSCPESDDGPPKQAADDGTDAEPPHASFEATPSRRLRLDLCRVNLQLEAAHEELRSAREELETMNEELQATNEELQTINEELRQRGTELNETSALFGAVLGSLRAGVVVLDDDLRVLAWNAKMTDLFGMRSQEASGKYFPSLEIGLPLTDLADALRSAAEARDEVSRTVDGTNRHGIKTTCEIRLAPLRGPHAKGVIVLVGEMS